MRYLPLTDADRTAMLARIGVADIDALFADIPDEKRLNGVPLDLPLAAGELEVERALDRLAARNVAAGSVPFFLGAGAYKHHVPATVDHLWNLECALWNAGLNRFFRSAGFWNLESALWNAVHSIMPPRCPASPGSNLPGGRWAGRSRPGGAAGPG